MNLNLPSLTPPAFSPSARNTLWSSLVPLHLVLDATLVSKALLPCLNLGCLPLAQLLSLRYWGPIPTLGLVLSPLPPRLGSAVLHYTLLIASTLTGGLFSATPVVSLPPGFRRNSSTPAGRICLRFLRTKVNATSTASGKAFFPSGLLGGLPTLCIPAR